MHKKSNIQFRWIFQENKEVGSQSTYQILKKSMGVDKQCMMIEHLSDMGMLKSDFRNRETKAFN